MSIVTEAGLQEITEYFLKQTGTLSFKLHLFKNDFTPDVDTVLADLTECTANGYASVALVGSNWSGGVTAGVASYDYIDVDFAFSGGDSPAQTVYGLFITNSASSVVYWAGRFTYPYLIPSSANTFTVKLHWGDMNCP